MQRSAASTPTDYSYNQPPSSAPPEQAPDNSDYDPVFSNASTNDYQDPVYDDSSIAADYLREVRAQRIAGPTADHNYIAPSAASPTPAIRVQRHTTPPQSPPHQHNPPLVPNVDSDDNSPYLVPSRTPSSPSPAYCRTSPIEPDDNELTTDNDPRPAYDNETRETISHPIDSYFDYSAPEYDSEASWASSSSSYSSPSVDHSVPTWHGTSPRQPATMDTQRTHLAPVCCDTPRPGTAISRQSRQTPWSNATFRQHSSPNGIQ